MTTAQHSAFISAEQVHAGLPMADADKARIVVCCTSSSDPLFDGAQPRSGPALFKSVGMGWEDLVIASALHARQ